MQVCEDINECTLTHNGGCHELRECINTAGSFECGPCIDGYIDDGDKGCKFADPCAAGVHNCEKTEYCINHRLGEFYCEVRERRREGERGRERKRGRGEGEREREMVWLSSWLRWGNLNYCFFSPPVSSSFDWQWSWVQSWHWPRWCTQHTADHRLWDTSMHCGKSTS